MNISKDLPSIQYSVFDPFGFVYTDAIPELESSEYGACSFQLNGLNVQFRVSKITPTKIGAFVTLWKREGRGPIKPFDIDDPIDLCIISSRLKERQGVFIFPKSLLFEKGVLSGNGKEGKRAIRVYPKWDKTESAQAIKTQKWQTEYFFEIGNEEDLERLNALIIGLSLTVK